MHLQHSMACSLLGLAIAVSQGCSSTPEARAGDTSPVGDVRQLVLVTTAGWEASVGTLRRYERSALSSEWQEVGEPFAVVVGRSGLGWGIGRHDNANRDGPTKEEGDGRAPAGTFGLSSAFGYAAHSDVDYIKLPYVNSTDQYLCIDDPASEHYNRLVNTQGVPADWNSRERMLRDDHLYSLGVVVDHNWADQTQPGKGSCIFLHVWRGPDQPTVGCTAMDEGNLRTLLGWLDPRQTPTLVQLPEETYRSLQGGWQLPEIDAL